MKACLTNECASQPSTTPQRVKEFEPAKYRCKNLKDAAKKIETSMSKWKLEKAEVMVEIVKQFSESNSANFMKLFLQCCEQYKDRPC